MTLTGKINSLWHHPIIIKDILQGKNSEEIRARVRNLNELAIDRRHRNEVNRFISRLKQSCIRKQPSQDYTLKLNRLCSIEDWEREDFRELICELQKYTSPSYIERKNWDSEKPAIIPRKRGCIHRKDWEWALGIIAMNKFDKINKNNIALGVGSGREEVIFYLANKLGHVYATDLYDGGDWNNFAPADFPDNPKKYAPILYDEGSLTVLKVDGTDLSVFPSESFDITFSFSSIEHFGGKNHSKALQSVREMERVLKPKGIAIVTTEYIINHKSHPEFFNDKTIYSDLIDKLDVLKLVEPLDLSITSKTLDALIDYPMAVYWDTSANDNFRTTHPLIVIRVRDLLVTSLMLVLQKESY